MKGNYDNVAPFYDLLGRFIFGNAILQANLVLVNAVQANSSILIVGGGTGYILEEISKKHDSGLQITYVEVSKKMMSLSKKRNTGNNKVLLINESIADISFLQQYDVVITPFFFDNFTDNTAKTIFIKLHDVLTSNGLWLFADFQLSKNNNIWKRWMLDLMYFFFRVFCNIETSHLPDTKLLFEANNYQSVFMKSFYKDFIYAVIYKKQ